jgi:integrase
MHESLSNVLMNVLDLLLTRQPGRTCGAVALGVLANYLAPRAEAMPSEKDERHGMEERSRARGGQAGGTDGSTAPVGFRRVRVHDLKHTFGRRLRAAGVSFEDRQDLLGHKSARITTHYSAPELANLIAAAERVCDDDSRKSRAITLLRRRAG